MLHVQRKINEIWLWDYEKRNPIVMDHDEAVDLANQLLNAAGKMSQEKDEEVTTDAR